VAAIRAAQLGLKTACIEKDKTLGGTCLNVGCIPSKALLHSSELFAKISHEMADNGIQVSQYALDFTQMMSRKNKIIGTFNKGIEGLFQKNKIDWIQGAAKLVGEHQVEVAGKIIEGKSLILATGSEPTSLPFLPFDEKKVVSSTGALAFQEVPKKLLVVGAGIIGVELGSVYQRLGSEVVFVEFLDRICPAFDSAMSTALQKSLTAQGMKFHLSHKVKSANIGKTVSVTAESPSGEVQFSADVVLVSVGRKPYSEGLGLEKVGIEKDERGFVKIDSSFRTSAPHIFAIGDLVNGPMLAHKASEEGVAVAELLAGKSPSIDYALIPNVAYTSPEVASVGFTEEELKKGQIAYKAGQFPFKANSRAKAVGQEEGFVKILAEEKTAKILGVHIFGANASEMVHEAAVAMKMRATAFDLAETCHAHPTLSEAIKEAALAVVSRPIHM